MARIHVEMSIDIPAGWPRDKMADYIADAVMNAPIGTPDETAFNTRTFKLTYRNRGDRNVITRKDSVGKAG
jgi:hypothetical protein